MESDSKSINQTYVQWRASQLEDKLRQPKSPIIAIKCKDVYEKPIISVINQVRSQLSSAIGREVSYSMTIHELEKQECLIQLQTIGFTEYEIRNNKCFYHPDSTWSYEAIKDFAMATGHLPPRQIWDEPMIGALLLAIHLWTGCKIPTKQLPKQAIHLPIINP